MVEGALWDRRTEQGLIRLACKLEKSQGAPIGQPEETMAIGAFLAEQNVLFAPCRDQGQADYVFINLRVASRSRLTYAVWWRRSGNVIAGIL